MLYLTFPDKPQLCPLQFHFKYLNYLRDSLSLMSMKTSFELKLIFTLRPTNPLTFANNEEID